MRYRKGFSFKKTVKSLIPYLEHLANMYPIQYDFSDDYKAVYIVASKARYKVYLNDKNRYGTYTFYHKIYNTNSPKWHQQCIKDNLYYGLYLVASHDYNKSNGISKPDYNDFQMMYNEFLEEEKSKKQKKKGVQNND